MVRFVSWDQADDKLDRVLSDGRRHLCLSVLHGKHLACRSIHTIDRDSDLDLTDHARAELRIQGETHPSRERGIKRKGSWIERLAIGVRTV